MPSLNYAQTWNKDLLEILIQGTLTSPFVTSNVRWVGAKSFHFTQMSTSGYKNHNRKGGWNVGEYAQKDVPYTLTHGRVVVFLVDKADVEETYATISARFLKRHRSFRRRTHCFSQRSHRKLRRQRGIIPRQQHPSTQKKRCIAS